MSVLINPFTSYDDLYTHNRTVVHKSFDELGTQSYSAQYICM
jgi:hypothetical protein